MPADLLCDSYATLRMLDRLLGDFSPADAAEADGKGSPTAPTCGSSSLSVLPGVLLRAFGEIDELRDGLRQCRMDVQRAARQGLPATHEKLLEASSATEVAAISMLDGLARARRMVDRLEQAVAGGGAEGALGAELRDELDDLVTSLQFQDIVAQQLDYAASTLLEVEGRLEVVARSFDEGVARLMGIAIQAPEAEGEATALTVAGAFDPRASTENATDRQALADSVFGLTGAVSGP